MRFGRFQRAITVEKNILAGARNVHIRFDAVALDARAFWQYETDFAVGQLSAAG